MVRVLIILFLFVASSCKKNSYEVDAICEVTELYNYIVKWDIYPYYDGNVTIYTSLSPDYFNKEQAAAVVPISRGRADLVVDGSLNRRYFLLEFDEDHQIVVGVRSQGFETVYNFRDFGGLRSENHKRIRWGQIYRSGSLDSISTIDARRIGRMHINTLLDFRKEEHNSELSDRMQIKQRFHFPISANQERPFEALYSGQMRRKDAIKYMQGAFCRMAQCDESLKNTFNVLSDPASYPVVLSCDYGTIQTSLVAVLLLHILEIPMYTITEDYLLNNTYFEMTHVAPHVNRMPSYTQEAITTLLASEEIYIQTFLTYIKEKYGSVNNYLQDCLGITDQDKEVMRSLLLR